MEPITHEQGRRRTRACRTREFDALSFDESSERPANGTTVRLLAICKEP